MEKKNKTVLSSSFRDPNGFVFRQQGEFYRQVNKVYQPHYNHLISSGLYRTLVESELLISHKEESINRRQTEEAYKIIKPQPIPFISYPYEWCFSALKEAALTTLKIQKTALAYGMILKDASSFNIQFEKGRPIFIDTLSFAKYQEGQPWIGYRQFCQHFLAPLALAVYRDVRLLQLLRLSLDGIPLDLTSKLLPKGTWLKFSFLSHIHLHAQAQKKITGSAIKGRQQKVNRRGLTAIIDSLEKTISSLTWSPVGKWNDYYQKQMNYSPLSFSHKKELVKTLLKKIKPKTVWDLGANIGIFSRIAASLGAYTISLDNDYSTMELNYQETKNQPDINILPLVVDLVNPTPNLGWANEERTSLIKRGPADCLLALALVHHLAIGNNLPFNKIAAFFAQIGKKLIIEFVPKQDSNCQKLLAAREDIFPAYKREAFEKEFGKYFSIRKAIKISDSERILYLMSGKD